MEKLKGFLKSRKFGFALVSLFPLFVFYLSVRLLVRHTVVNISFALTFILVPALAWILLYFTVFSNKKTAVKTGLSVCILAISAVLFLGLISFGIFEEYICYKNEKAETAYSEIENRYMPKLSEVGNPISIEYHYFCLTQMIFASDTDTLICKYDEENYEKQKELLDERYVFQNSDGLKAWAPTTIDGYEFRMLSKDEYDLYYPKNIIYIATNDETKEIVYMNYYDDDLDYIDSLAEFIENDCGWKYIR